MEKQHGRAGTLVRIGVVLTLVVFVVARTDLGALAEHVDGRAVLAVFVVQPLCLLALLLTAWRHAVLIKQPRAPLPTAFKAVVLAVGLNLVLPGRISELFKATYMRDHADAGLSSGMAAVLIERLCDLIVVGLIALAATAVLLFEVDAWLIVTGVGLAALILVLLSRADVLLRSVVAVLPVARLRLFATRILTHSAGHVRDGRVRFTLLVGVLIWVVSVGIIAGVLRFGGSVPLGVAGILTVFVATTIGGAIPALPAGLGTYEAAAVLSLQQFGYSFEEAIVLGLAMHATQFVIAVPMSLYVLVTERVGVGNVMKEVMAAARGDAVVSTTD